MNNRTQNIKTTLLLIFFAICLGNFSYIPLWLPQLFGFTMSESELLISESVATSSILLFFVTLSIVFYFCLYSALFQDEVSA